MPSRRRFIATAAGAGAALAAGPAVRLVGGAAGTGDAGRRSGLERSGAGERAHPHDGCARHRGAQRHHPRRPHRRGRQRAAVGRRGPPHRPARPHGGAGPDRAARAHRQPGEPPGLPHAAREHDLDSRDPGDAGGAPQERARRPVDHVDGRLAHQPVGRASAPDAEGAGRSGARSSGAALRALHRPVRHQHAGQEVLRRRRRRRLAAPELPEDQRVRRRRDRRSGRQGRPVVQRAVPPAPDADVRGQAAQHAGRDGLLRRPWG